LFPCKYFRAFVSLIGILIIDTIFLSACKNVTFQLENGRSTVKTSLFFKVNFYSETLSKNLLIRIKKYRWTFIPVLYKYTFSMLRMVPQSAKIPLATYIAMELANIWLSLWGQTPHFT